MKITYSVLWFDDVDEYFESLDFSPLEDTIRSWGFDPKFTLVTDPEEFMKYEPFHEFDLIVVDYNLEEYDKYGEEFIKKIRDHDVYTEVVFYSANPASELWDAVRKQELEGVFIASRPSVLTKIEKVAEQSVRKMLDLENVRGIVMAEVGNIDVQLDNIINKAYGEITPEQQQKIFDRYIGKIASQHQDNIDVVTNLDDSTSIAPLLSFCDSSKKWNLFQSLGKNHSKIKVNEFGDYGQEVLIPRNFLAHGTPVQQKDGSLSFEFHGKSFIFNEKVSSDLRSALQRYSAQFEETHQDL